MTDSGPRWLAPSTLSEALSIRAEMTDEATIVAGGTFIGILMNQGFLFPSTLLSLREVPGLDNIDIDDGDGSLRIGPMTTHTAIVNSSVVRTGWSTLAQTFALVASPRVRNQATVGGVLGDADYASDPPAMFSAMGASVVAQSVRGKRAIAVEDLIVGPYETSLEPDELIVEVRVPSGIENAVYRKFRSRSSEDRPCVAVAAVRRPNGLRVVVGAATGQPQYFPDACAAAVGSGMDSRAATEIGAEYARRIEPLSDSRGSAEYRRRIIAVEVRRALEKVWDA